MGAVFSKAQLKKLTPAEKKARAKRLAYNRAYYGKKNKAKKAKPSDKGATVRSKKAEAKAEVSKLKTLPRYDIESILEKIKRLHELYGQIDVLVADIKGDVA